MAPALWQALGICPGDLVALTGGGGKTSTARRVLRELLAAGRPSVFTTTTKIFRVPEMDLVLLRDSGYEAVAAALAAGRNVCVAAEMEPPTQKLIGITVQEAEALRSLVGDGAVLVEADGSGQRPLKAPAAHEPVIPPTADLVVPVAGASALGRALTPDLVHRPQEVARAAGVELGAPVTGRVMAAALLACTAGAPAGARIVPLLSQADLPGAGSGLAEAASLLVGQEPASPGAFPVGRVVVAAPRAPEPVLAVHGDVTALVLAGGESRRFGSSKLLHPWQGRTILEAAMRAALRAGFREVLVATGAYHDRLLPLLQRYPVRVVENPDWQVGMSASVKAGVRALADDPPEGLIIFLGDQPRLPARVPVEVVRAFRRTGAALAAPQVAGARKSPVLFGRRLYPELLAIDGDEGGRQVVAAHRHELAAVEFQEPDWFGDIDSPEDLT